MKPLRTGPETEERPRWYAVHTRPRMEDKASVYLRRQGYWTFYPFERVVRFRNRLGRRGIRIEIELPFFSRYIFVLLNMPHQSLYDVNETYGVSTVVHIGGEPLEIAPAVIDELMQRTDEQGLVRRAKPTHWFAAKVGDKVQLADESPYFGLITELASLDNLDAHDQISIWLDFLGAKREVPVSVHAVARIVA